MGSVELAPQTDFVLSIEDPKGRWTFYPKEDLPVAGGSNGTYRLEHNEYMSGKAPQSKPQLDQ